MLIVLITIDMLFLIFKKAGKEEITDLSLNLLGKLMNSIPLLTN